MATMIFEGWYEDPEEGGIHGWINAHAFSEEGGEPYMELRFKSEDVGTKVIERTGLSFGSVQDIDALRRYCEMVLDHHSKGLLKLE
jgi:hypothetical protein